MSNEKSIKDILLSELDNKVKQGIIKESDATIIINRFHEEMEEGYSNAEALYKSLYEIKSLKKEKPIFNGDNENECEEWANRE